MFAPAPFSVTAPSSNSTSDPDNSLFSAASNESIPIASCVGCNATSPHENYCPSCPDTGFIFADVIPSDQNTNLNSSITSSNPLLESSHPSVPSHHSSNNNWHTELERLCTTIFPSQHAAGQAITALQLALVDDDVLETSLSIQRNRIVLSFRFSTDYPTSNQVIVCFRNDE